MSGFSSILKKYWGYDAFRPLQLEAIERVVSGRDTLVLMPTGGGKSVVYQVPAIAMEGTCVVVTPLVALMKDQRDALRKKGLSALAVHAGISRRETDRILDNCVYGNYKFLFIAPERIDSELFRTRFSRMNISLITVDEAHCISQWGYDFRPAYLRIARLREIFPEVPVLALTASATEPVAEDIMDKLNFGERTVLRMGFGRSNLSYVVRRTENKPEQLLRILGNVPGTGIVYSRTREKTEKIAEFLRENGISSDFYHAGLGHRERSLKQERWISGETRIMVATNAFGMGIDKADVRTVIHTEPCDSPEAYYQEAGRAGRDGRPAYAVMLVSETDLHSVKRRIGLDFPPLDLVRKIYEAVCNHFQIATGSGKGFASEFNIYDFCARYRFFLPTVVNAMKILQLNGYLMMTDETERPSRILFTVSRDDLYRVRVNREELDYFIKVLLRTYPGIFTQQVAINESEIAHLSGYTLEKVYDLLKTLWQMRLIRYIPGGRAALVVFHEERLSPENLRIAPETYAIRKKIAEQRLDALREYIENRTECRSVLLSRYFGEVDALSCGRCDVCREPAGGSFRKEDPIEDRIAWLLRERSRDIREIASEAGGNIDHLLAAVRRMTEKGIVRQEADGKIRLMR